MEKKLTKEMWEKAKAQGKAKRLEKPADAEKLSDEDMANVAGGFVEEDFNRGAWQQWVQCPKCYEHRKQMFRITDNDFYEGTTYRCKTCGCEFIVDNEGFTCDLDDLAALFMLGALLN